MTNVYLGNNLIRNCEAVLIVERVEVFRLRERSGDAQLVVDFDVRDKDGNKIAKIAKNNVVFVAEGYEKVNGPKESFVRNIKTGEIIAKAEELSDTSIRIIGDFWIDGFHVSISNDALVFNSITLAGNRINGFKKGIVLDSKSMGIGIST